MDDKVFGNEDIVAAYHAGFVDGYNYAMSGLIEQVRQKTKELSETMEKSSEQRFGRTNQQRNEQGEGASN